MRNILLIIFIIFSATNFLFAQASEEWIRRFNWVSDDNDNQYALVLDKFGNVYVGGGSSGRGTSGDFTIIKYNSAGSELWIARYNSPDSLNDELYSISLDQNCNVYASGKTNAGITTVKFNSSGNFEWVRNYTISNNIEIPGNKIRADNSGNVYVWGAIWTFDDNSGFYLLKYDSSGVTKWIKHFHDELGSIASDMALDKQGNIYVTGDYYLFNADNFLTIKYNPDGDTLWARIYNSFGYYSHTRAIAVDTSGNVFVTGESGGSPFLYWAYKYNTVKYDSAGNLKWVRRYDGNGPDRDFAFAMALDKSGNIFVTGYSSGPGGSFDYATVKYNSNGDSLWVKRYNSPGNGKDVANSVSVDEYGNAYVTGSSKTHNQQDFATVKYSSTGNQLWVANYNGSGNSNDDANVVVCDEEGNIYVSGTSVGINTGNDFLTIKYSQITGIQSHFSQELSEYSLLQNYPNPFNASTEISYSILKNEFISIKIYDITGKEILTLVNEFKNAGNHKINFNASELPSGIYFYKIRSGNFVDVKRMALTK